MFANSFIPFLQYMATAVVLLLVFMFAYVKFTPYDDFDEIRTHFNSSVAYAFGGAIIGFALPIASAIYFTHSLLEMVLWGFITGVVQIIVFAALQAFFKVSKAMHEDHNMAMGIFVGAMAVAVGILNAISISN
jgi:putative membrane protein